MTVQLHMPEFEKLLGEVGEVVPIAREWVAWMGFCPDALFEIATDGAKQAIKSIEDDHGDTCENALRATYLAGFIMGVLAEREVNRL